MELQDGYAPSWISFPRTISGSGLSEAVKNPPFSLSQKRVTSVRFSSMAEERNRMSNVVSYSSMSAKMTDA